MKVIKKIKDKIKNLLHLNPNPVSLNEDCTEFEVNNWVTSKFIISKLAPIVGVHPYPLTELNLMVAAICRLRPGLVFEWGTNIGKSARIFYETAKYFKINLLIHSIDLPESASHQEHPRKDHAKMVRKISSVKLHRGDGLNKTIEIYQNNNDLNLNQRPPLIFIDGDHSYESVKRELVGIITNIPNANILLHDTFYQSPNSRYNTGPNRAIEETLKEFPNQFKVISTTTGLPGMTLLYHL